jgi:hypothetical protein
MNGERRRSRGGTTASMLAARPGTILVAKVLVCVECARRAPAPDAHHCPECITAYLAGLRRRRAAELRLQPLVELGIAC